MSSRLDLTLEEKVKLIKENECSSSYRELRVKKCKVLKLLYSNKTIKYIQLISLNDLTTFFNHYLLTLLLYEHSAILNVFH